MKVWGHDEVVKQRLERINQLNEELREAWKWKDKCYDPRCECWEDRDENGRKIH